MRELQPYFDKLLLIPDVIYARALSERAILDAIRAGHVFVDVEGSKDRTLEFEAKTGLNTASMGDSIQAAAGEKIHFTVKMSALQGAYSQIIQDGQSTALLDKSATVKADEIRGLIMRAMAEGIGFE
jgi:hypothetical protein